MGGFCFTEAIDISFWVAVFSRLIVDSAALLFYIKALKHTHLSLAIPMMSFVPVFLIFVSLIVNHLFPTPLGIIGTLVIVAGVYFLNFDHDTKHLLSPFFAIRNDKGVQYMFLASFLWAWVAALQKLGIDHSNVTFYTAFFQPVWAICFLPLAFFVNKKEFLQIFQIKNLKMLLPIGALDAIQVAAQNIAFTLALPVYVTAVGGTNLLFVALFGAWFFKEKIGNKLLPTAVIFIGVILIAIAQPI
jgi:drug/metabolite transporter (DMT)-like permease